jgi:hypothetical protein
MVWKQLKSVQEISELAEFAILLLGIIVNQAGNERDFSDCGVKKTKLRNRLGIPKLQKMSKVSEIPPYINDASHQLFEGWCQYPIRTQGKWPGRVTRKA